MGFLSSKSGGAAHATRICGLSVDAIHKLECKACPLNKVTGLAHPHMAPTGSTTPTLYFLGEAPGEQEDELGKQFVGESGQLLRSYVPKEWMSRIRWNNVVRTRPPRNRTPEPLEIEACRPSIIRDIEQTKPKALVGFGGVSLAWATGPSNGGVGRTGISIWRGRRMPLQIGSHKLWFYPMFHPAYLLRMKKGGRRPGSEDERAFDFDMERLFGEADRLVEPWPHTIEAVRSGITIYYGVRRDDIGQIERYFKWAIKQTVIGVDIETNALRPYGADAKILSVAFGAIKTIAIALDHPEAKWTRSQRARLDELIKHFLVTKGARKTVHSLQFELEWFGVKYGREVLRASDWDCTMVQASVIDGRVGERGKRGPLSLDFLVQQYFGFGLKQLSSMDRAALEKAPIEEVLVYNGMDAKYHMLLDSAQLPLIRREKLTQVYGQTLRRAPTLVLTQMKGFPVDFVENRKLAKQEERTIKKSLTAIMESDEAHMFRKREKRLLNPGSNRDLVVLFKTILKAKEGWRDNKDPVPKYSVDEDTLTEIGSPFCKNLLLWRKAQKLKSTYIDPYSEGSPNVYPDGLVHPSFNSVLSATKRLSCEGPNLQNLPKRVETLKKVRKQLAAPPGCLIVAVDYGQIEARVASMCSGPGPFNKALWERFDIHGDWAHRLGHAYPSRVGGRSELSDKKVMKAFRTDVKNQWSFPLIFDSSLDGISANIQIPLEIIEEQAEEFWKEFPELKEWQEKVKKFYRKNFYIEALNGTRFPGPLRKNQVVNFPIQSTAAVLIMDAMSRLSEKYPYRYQPNIQIHDDLSTIFSKKGIDAAVEKIVTEMVTFDFEFINCPIVVEVSLGPNLLEMEEVLVASSDTWFK